VDADRQVKQEAAAILSLEPGARGEEQAERRARQGARRDIQASNFLELADHEEPRRGKHADRKDLCEGRRSVLDPASAQVVARSRGDQERAESDVPETVENERSEENECQAAARQQPED